MILGKTGIVQLWSLHPALWPIEKGGKGKNREEKNKCLSRGGAHRGGRKGREQGGEKRDDWRKTNVWANSVAEREGRKGREQGGGKQMSEWPSWKGDQKEEKGREK